MAWVLSGNIRGPQGPAGLGVRYRGNVNLISDLPADTPPGTNAVGDLRIVLTEPGKEGYAFIWEESTITPGTFLWVEVGPWLGPTGPQGDPGVRGSRWSSGALTMAELNTTPLAGQLVNDHYLHTEPGTALGDVFRLD